MATPFSATASYCTPDQLLTYYDKRQLGDWLLDSDHREIDPVQNPRTQEALDSAAGMVESACVVGARYSPDDLASLQGVSKKTLQMINAHLAGSILRNRRKPDAELTTMAKWAFEHLERLRLGERIFGLQENADAGLPSVNPVSQEEIANDSTAVTNEARRFFGSHSQ
jgi:hypothetical protein